MEIMIEGQPQQKVSKTPSQTINKLCWVCLSLQLREKFV
jgi:hypothetical protein